MSQGSFVSRHIHVARFARAIQLLPVTRQPNQRRSADSSGIGGCGNVKFTGPVGSTDSLFGFVVVFGSTVAGGFFVAAGCFSRTTETDLAEVVAAGLAFSDFVTDSGCSIGTNTSLAAICFGGTGFTGLRSVAGLLGRGITIGANSPAPMTRVVGAVVEAAGALTVGLAFAVGAVCSLSCEA